MKKSNLIQAIGLVVLCYLSGNWGYWQAIRTTTPQNHRKSAENRGSTTLLPDEIRATSTIAKQGEASSSLGGPGTTRIPASSPYMDLVAQHRFESRHSYFAAIFSPNRTGELLTQASTFLKFTQINGTPEGQLAKQQVRSLLDQPRATFEELQQNLPKLAPNYALERQYWVQFVSRLDIDSNSKIAFFSDEVQRSTAGYNAQDPSTFNGVSALSSLMRETQDPNVVEPVVRQTLMQLSNPNAKALILNAYSSKFPSQAKSLRDEFLR